MAARRGRSSLDRIFSETIRCSWRARTLGEGCFERLPPPPLPRWRLALALKEWVHSVCVEDLPVSAVVLNHLERRDRLPRIRFAHATHYFSGVQANPPRQKVL